jgi:hypothetical protein
VLTFSLSRHELRHGFTIFQEHKRYVLIVRPVYTIGRVALDMPTKKNEPRRIAAGILRLVSF